MLNTVIAIALLSMAILHQLEVRRFIKKRRSINRLDCRKFKHMKNIQDFQIAMFDCISKQDIYGAAAANELISDEIRMLDDVIKEMSKLISN